MSHLAQAANKIKQKAGLTTLPNSSSRHQLRKSGGAHQSSAKDAFEDQLHHSGVSWLSHSKAPSNAAEKCCHLFPHLKDPPAG